MKNGQSIIGVNAHMNYMRNRPLFYERMRRLNPSMIVAFIDDMNHRHWIDDLKRNLPDTIVVSRMYHPMDGAFHMRRHDGAEWVSSPSDTLNWLGGLGRDGLVCSLLNEPGTGGDVERLMKWTTETLVRATHMGVVTCIGNFSVGTPGIRESEWEPGFDLLLKALQDSPHYLGLHEYLPGETYRVGRILMMIRRCATLGYKMPKVLITEYGVDTDGGALNGYRSRGWTGQQYAETLCEVAQRVYMPLVNASVLHGAAVFCYGNSGGWENFDVETDNGFWDTLEKHAPRYKAPAPPIPVKPMPTDWTIVRNLVHNISLQLDELKKIVGE